MAECVHQLRDMNCSSLVTFAGGRPPDQNLSSVVRKRLGLWVNGFRITSQSRGRTTNPQTFPPMGGTGGPWQSPGDFRKKDLNSPTSPVRPNQLRPASGIEGYRRVMADSWLLSIQRRAYDVRVSELETATPTETIIQPTLDDGDHDRFAHFARKADIVNSAVTGRPLVALCGKVWVPGRNPDRYPVCSTCREIYQRKKAEETGA